MKRKVDEKEVRALLKELRRRIPGLTLRTTLIVGFPGETEAQYQKLADWVEETEFDRLGVFTYSQEEGTQAALMKDQVAKKTKEKRRDHLMTIQQKISARKNAQLKGKSIAVLVDQLSVSSGGYPFMGRTEGQALEIDGNVFLRGRDVRVGTFVNAKVSQTAEYDLFAEII
jgi:ribosomal protein S12 methylthiotransferase